MCNSKIAFFQDKLDFYSFFFTFIYLRASSQFIFRLALALFTLGL